MCNRNSGARSYSRVRRRARRKIGRPIGKKWRGGEKEFLLPPPACQVEQNLPALASRFFSFFQGAFAAPPRADRGVR